jgi:hypothetical protein
MRPTEKIEKFLQKASVSSNPEVNKAVLNELAEEMEKTKQTGQSLNMWRIIMKNKLTKFAAAACIIIAAVLILTIFNKSVPTAYAADLLAQAVKALPDFNSIHIKARMRTLPADNFSLIKLDLDFVPIELWKKVNDSGLIKWKVEKPGRLLVMDGNSTTFLIKPNMIQKSGPSPYIRGYDCEWFGRIVDVRNLLESEYKYVCQTGNTGSLLRHQTIDGRDKLVLEVNFTAQGNYTNDYVKNAFIDTSDHTKIYYFDAETKLLENFEIIVHTGKEDVLVFETTQIEYDPQIDDNVFVLNLPENTITFKNPQVLPDNDKYQKMSPKEAATAFFEACAQKNWGEFLKFWMMSDVKPETKDRLGGLEIISIGEPFKSGIYPGWFVPYEFKTKDGTVRKFNLAVRNDNPARRYVVDGGI